MRVGVLGFGSVWRHRLGRQDVRGHVAQPVYYNTTGIAVNGEVHQRPQICGYARFDSAGGFDPNHVRRMIHRVFECAEPCLWMGYNKLLFRRILYNDERADLFLAVAKSEQVGQLPVGKEGWRSLDTWVLSFSECAGQQEALLLMSPGGWIRSSLGRFVLESSATRSPQVQFVLHAEE